MGAHPAGWGFVLYPPTPDGGDGNGADDNYAETRGAAGVLCDSEHAPCSPDAPMSFIPKVGPPVTSIRWELQRRGLEDSERFYILQQLYQAAMQHCAGLEAYAKHMDCCCSLVVNGSALDRVREVVWDFPWMGVSQTASFLARYLPSMQLVCS
eukprot:SAG31_NODE_671_length_12940_cov_4.703606_4_plen_153_part_00